MRGGTGFLVGIRSPRMPFNAYIYAVTNAHLAPQQDSGDSVYARFNRFDGTFEIIELHEGKWHRHPDADDIAICELGLNLERVNQTYVSESMFLTEKLFIDNGIGPGDDVFMIGRFQTIEGKDQNTPTARFGNISQLFAREVKNSFGLNQLSFIVEMRSLSGYSGSPVFAYLMPFYKRDAHPTTEQPNPPAVNLLPNGVGPWLIGVDWGHLNRFQEVLDQDRKTPEVPPRWVKENSGMSMVVPIDRLTDLLQKEELRQHRNETEAILAEAEMDANSSNPAN